MTSTSRDKLSSGDGQRMREHKGLVVGAAGMMVAGVLTANLSPLLAISFADELGFGIEKAGLLVSCGQGGVALSVLLMVPLLPRLNRKFVGVTGAVIAATCLALTGFSTAFPVVLALQIAMGLGAGLSYASANSSLAYSRFPERAFGIVIITSTLVGSALLTLGPHLHDMWPEAGIYLGIAAAELLCVVLILRLPDVHALPKDAEDTIEAADSDDIQAPSPGSDAADQGSSKRHGRALTAALLIGAIWLMNVGNAMIWTFSQSIGIHAGLSSQSTATFLGTAQLTGILGTGVTMLYGSRVHKMSLIVPAGVALGVGSLLAGVANTPTPFIIGFLALFVGFYCLGPLLLALAAELDTSSGRLVVFVSAVALAAAGMAPALGGAIAGSTAQWSRLGCVSLVAALVAIPMLALPVRTAKKRATFP